MFAFDIWAEWVELSAGILQRRGLTATYADTMANPRAGSNPSFGLEIETPERVGSINFWRVGLCDYEILSTSTKELVADENMLDTNDDNVPALLAQFISFFNAGPATATSPTH